MVVTLHYYSQIINKNLKVNKLGGKVKKQKVYKKNKAGIEIPAELNLIYENQICSKNNPN
jgi:hypothetical protein